MKKLLFIPLLLLISLGYAEVTEKVVDSEKKRIITWEDEVTGYYPTYNRVIIDNCDISIKNGTTYYSINETSGSLRMYKSNNIENMGFSKYKIITKIWAILTE